jgi:hypothetical protein
MTISKLAEQAISALTPQFLAVIILNILFIGILFWFVDQRAQHSMAVINQLLHACLKDQP